MSQEILSNVLKSKISPEEIIKWLTTDIHQNLNWGDISHSTSRAEFVAFFLNFLRDQFASSQQPANNIKQTTSKKIVSQKSSAPVLTSSLPHEIDNSGSCVKDFSSLYESRPFEESNNQGSIKAVLRISSSTENGFGNQDNTKQVSESSYPDSNVSEPNKEIPEVENNKIREKINDAVFATSNTKTSTPVIEQRISLHSMPLKSGNLSGINDSFSASFNGEISNSSKSACITSPNNRNFDYVLTDSNRALSPIDSSFVNIVKDQSINLNSSFSSQNYSQSECTDSCSQPSGNSVISELHVSHSPLLVNKNYQNPISPLYSHSITMTPKNSKKVQNKSSDRQSRSKSHFQHSTPEQITNSSQKSAKSVSRQSISLGDFITTDAHASKKKSRRKSNQKMQLLRSNRDDDTVPKSSPILTDESFPEVGQSFEKKRRIKPTKLDISDNKGNKENTVFGVVNRPVTTNPQFSEVQSTDQTSNIISFETERVLLKLERQKKPETTTINKVGDFEPPIKFSLRTPRKPVLSKSIVVPCMSLVDNSELLNTLAQLYSSFINNNLIPNPMTELYFILSLITTQYLSKTSLDKSTMNKSNVDNSSGLKFVELKQEDLEKDLGCKVLEEADRECDLLTLFTENSKLLLGETGEKLKKLSLIYKAKTLPEIDGEEGKNCFKIDELRLGTPHNSVYFSTRVLNEQRRLLNAVDRATLKLLSENVHIAAFQSDLQEYLVKLYNFKLSEFNRSKQQDNFSIADSNVCFQIDTDNRENFPSTIAFQCFRKQRDLFYEILKIWEENHSKTNWKYSIALSGKIKSMLTLYSDVTNHCHIARLFKSQLLISCIHSGQQVDFIDEESLGILKSLKGVNLEKLTQLKERLVTPLSSQGLVPEPSFPGMQEFYKNFILYSFNPMFYAHLEDCLIHEIMELNDAQFAGSEIEDTETMVDERTKHNFITCLSSLRLLAKFLGFLVSLPYRSTTSVLEEVIDSQVALRRRIVPSLDLQYCLQEAIIRGNLSLTIPWMVEYLSQLDVASLRLPYYTRLLEMLYCIYRISDLDSFVNFKQFMSEKTSVLIKFSLGWLFELPNFPTDLYFSCQSTHTSKKLKTICQIEDKKMEVSVSTSKRNSSLDKLEIIDDGVLYSCCPFLTEFKILLTTGNSQTTNSKSNRHITPVSSQLLNAADSTNKKNLELQLEEAFFHGQPASTRKTVEFVSERVASTCVKYICNSVLPLARENSLTEVRRVIEEKYKKNFEDDPNCLKSLMLRDMNALAASISGQVKKQCEEVIPLMCRKRVSQSIESLLAEDTLIPVKETCTQIAVRMAIDRIRQWIQSHIVGGSLFMRDMESEINRIIKSDNSIQIVSDNHHNSQAGCPTDVLDDLRACMWEFLDNRGTTVALEFVLNILDQLCTCFTERSDLIHGPENCLRSLSVDFSLFLITHRTDLMTIEVQKKFIKFWKISMKKIPEADSALSRLLSPRNIMILEEANHNGVWIKTGEFIKLLLKEEVLSLENLSDQCVALLRQDWPTEILKNVSKCLDKGIEGYKAADEQAEKIRYLLRWIAEICYDIDNLVE